MSTSAISSNSTLSPQMLALLNGTSGGRASSTAASTPSGTSAQAIQDQFLKLLTTQLKAQDPLNPMDSSQMTSQLAQISTVSGVQQLNSTMQSMMSSNSALQTAQSAALIGHHVLGPGSSFALPASGGTTLGVSLPSAADKVTVNVKDAYGNLVKAFDLGAQTGSVATVSWDGTNAQGVAMGAGAYKVSAQASLAGKQITVTPLVQGTVTGVTSTSAGVNLDVAGVGSVALGSVAQID